MRSLPLVVLLCGPALAQDFRATLTGRVSDPGDAPVSAASVVVKNIGANTVSATKTNAQGNYSTPFLAPGLYSVTVEAPGFKKAVRGEVTLNVNQTATLNFRLELGAVTQEVTVTAEAPMLDQSTADRGGVIDDESVQEYPLNGRNPFMLSMLVAGVDFNGNLTSAIFRENVGTGNVLQENLGDTTFNNGTTTISSGASTVIVSQGCWPASLKWMPQWASC